MDEAKLKIIEENPIGDGLDAFRKEFASICDPRGLERSPGTFDRLEQSRRIIIAFDILMTLPRLQAAQYLPSASGDKLLLQDIDALKVTLAVNPDGFDFSRIRALLKAVLDNSDDVAFWTQVYKAFSKATPPPPQTPPPVASLLTADTRAIAATAETTSTADEADEADEAGMPSVPETPWTRNTVSILNSSEMRREVNLVLKEELGNPRTGIRKFRQTFFARVPGLETAAAAVFNKCCEGDEPVFGQDGWDGWPVEAKEADVLAWFENTITKLEELAADYRPTNLTYHRKLLAQPRTPLMGSTGRRSMDIGFVNDNFIVRPELGKAGKYRWSHVLVAGELKSNPIADAPPLAWIDLATYVREVLSAQDTRRFALAFTLCGSNLRLWEYDCLGGMASEQFNINEPKSGLEFVAAMLGFLWIDEEGLGFDPTIMESQDKKRFIEIKRNGKLERLILDEIIARPRAIASRATTCWKAHREDDPLKKPLVIKDSWQYPERDEEGLLIKEATEKGVVNVARYYHHETVYIGGVEDDIRTSIRKGLDAVAATTNTADAITGAEAAADTAATAAISDTVTTIAAPTTSTMSAITAMARRRSTSSSASSTPTAAAAAMSSSQRRGQGRGRGRSVASQSKKTTRVLQLRESGSRSGNSIRDGDSDDNSDNSGSSNAVAAKKRRQSEANLDDNDDGNTAVERPAKRSRSESVKSGDAKTLKNRVHRRVVLQDYARPIHTASSTTALLEALENCIRGHESLRQQASLLHRDISINNIMIDEDGPADRKGFLIDLDLAITEQRIKGSGAQGKTGTRAFMAINVLMGKQHSFMHDLESFFWVLFWICVHYDGPNKARTSDFDRWNYMRDYDLAGAKMTMIYDSEVFYRRVESSFTPFYVPLIPLMDKLRTVVFPNGQPWKEPNEELYSTMREILLQDLK